MHLSESQIQQMMHDALPDTERREAQRHLGECALCRESLAAARQEEHFIFGLLPHLDHVPPQLSFSQVTTSARPRSSWLRYAAGILLVVGAGGLAYALPGSPLRAWANRIFGAAAVRTDAGPSAHPAAPTDSVLSGIAVTPGADFVIAFAQRQDTGSIRILLTPDNQVTVRTLDGRVRFASGTDRLLIENHGSTADFEINIPRATRSITVQVAGETVFAKYGASIQPGRADPAGRHIIPLR